MILNLDKLDGDTQNIGADEIFEFDDAFGEPNRLHCHIDLAVRRAGETYYLSAALTGSFSTACHKCLEQTRQEVESALELVIQRVESRATGEDSESADESLILLPKGQREVMLDQLIFENLIVNIPIRILCRDDCKGLCPICGGNLNHTNCRCVAPVEAQWEGLRKLGDSSPE